MKRHILISCALILVLILGVSAQIPINTGVQILKAEDARRYDVVLEKLIKSTSAAFRSRAALAAGRIGDEKAVDALVTLLADSSIEVRAMAAFAIGEIESLKGSAAIIKLLDDAKTPDTVMARAVEAAGKIAAANPKDAKSKDLGDAVLDVLDAEYDKGAKQDRETVLLGITAVLRAHPNESEVVTAKFLTSKDARIRADAANTLTRLRAKNANAALRTMLLSDTDAVARANAARAVGAAEDKDALNLLLEAAAGDQDPRVRVSAIRSLGTLKDTRAAERLMERGEKLLAAAKASKFAKPVEKNEMTEIAIVLGRLLAGSGDTRAVKFLGELAMLDDARTPEISVARMRVQPGEFENTKRPDLTWREMSTTAQAVAELAMIDPKTDEAKKMKAEAPDVLKAVLDLFSKPGMGDDKKAILAMPDYLQAYARFKTDELDEVLRANLSNSDVQLRATAAGLLAGRPRSKENVDALEAAFDAALIKDKYDNDAQLAILNALYKIDKEGMADTLQRALDAPDYLLRKKAIDILKDAKTQKDLLYATGLLAYAVAMIRGELRPYSGKGTRLGQVLNTTADYRRALSRKNGTVKAVVSTEKGTFTIDFFSEDAPLTVDNFVKLARSGYFNGVEVHRVVPNFVMQDGDPRGDGNGGPGWSIRCEINLLPYDRGAVGMALSGKDTGGSQWFVTHSPQPHLDGGYTVFGHVNETGMKVVDNVVRGDKIISVKIIEANSPQRHRGH